MFQFFVDGNCTGNIDELEARAGYKNNKDGDSHALLQS